MARRQTKSNGQKALTSIPGGIHCAATPDQLEEQDELDEIAIDNFLDALAKVALAVARRRQQLPIRRETPCRVSRCAFHEFRTPFDERS